MTPTSRVPAVWIPAAAGPVDSQTVSNFTRTEAVPSGTLTTKQCSSTSSRAHGTGVPSGVSTRNPATSSTRPCGPCEPGNHFGYHSRSGPGLHGMSRVVWSSFRGSSRASTSTVRAGASEAVAGPASADRPTRAAARRKHGMGLSLIGRPGDRAGLQRGSPSPVTVLTPDEPASADDNDFHGCPLAAPSVAEPCHSAASGAAELRRPPIVPHPAGWSTGRGCLSRALAPSRSPSNRGRVPLPRGSGPVAVRRYSRRLGARLLDVLVGLDVPAGLDSAAEGAVRLLL